MSRNVLFVTTRQWNPGDEFIRMGVENVYEQSGVRLGLAGLHNRSPQVRSLIPPFNGLGDGAGILARTRPFAHSPLGRLIHLENSVSDHEAIDLFDDVVFCGTPEWAGGRVSGLLRRLRDFSGRVLFLGIGKSNRRIRMTPDLRAAFKRGTVTVRDAALQQRLAEDGIDVPIVPCPALLSVPLGSEDDSVPAADGEELVGVVYTAEESSINHRVSAGTAEVQRHLIRDLMRLRPVRVICHYWKDVVEVAKLFPDADIAYHWSAERMFDCYRGCHAVVSTRVHGCGAASSLGIPNAIIGHDARAGTASGFLSLTLEKDAPLSTVEHLIQDGAKLRTELRRHKEEAMATYRAILASSGTVEPAG